MRNIAYALIVLASLTLPQAVLASRLWFEPYSQGYQLGEEVNVALYADIDEFDAILGFGFDLSFDGGQSYVNAPGDRGTYLTFSEFAYNSDLFYQDEFFPALRTDDDTIYGQVPWTADDVWGTQVLLGVLTFLAPDSGPIGAETIHLGPDAGDLGLKGEEGLVGIFTALMPNNPTLTLNVSTPPTNPVPEPATMLLVGCGLIGIAGVRRRMKVKA